MTALWNLLIEVQTFPAGIAQSFVDEKKVETRRDKEGDARALTECYHLTKFESLSARRRLTVVVGRRIGNDGRPRDSG